MFSRSNRRIVFLSILVMLALTLAGQGLQPLSIGIKDVPTGVSSMQSPTGFKDAPAIPNDSGIEGVQTFPDKAVYHIHVNSLPEPKGNIPPPFGQHYSYWQNCGIYDQPVELGNALHSMEHGAVWLTYRPNLDAGQVKALQDLVRGHPYVLMSPYPPQTDDVVLTAWGVQLVIKSVPDDRISKFIAYYALGPQTPERGAPCDGGIGVPLQQNVSSSL